MESDAALIVGIKAGNKSAMAELVERHKRTAFRMALGLVGNRDDAFDISQEAFLRVFRSARTYDETQPFLPWFYTIVQNLSLSWLRKRSRIDRRTVDLDDVSGILAGDSNPEREVIRRETVKKLGEALMKLTFADREIIMLQHFRNMSYDEIAQLLAIPKGTVMSRLYYARKRLGILMRDHHE